MTDHHGSAGLLQQWRVWPAVAAALLSPAGVLSRSSITATAAAAGILQWTTSDAGTAALSPASVSAAAASSCHYQA